MTFIRKQPRRKFNNWNDNKEEFYIGYIPVRIDREDFDLVDYYTWRFDSKGYVVSSIGCTRKDPELVYLHRLIMNTPDDETVHHINNNRRDCRKINMTNIPLDLHLQQTVRKIGRAGFKGVTMHIANDGTKSYYAKCRGRMLGIFGDGRSAARAYDEFAIKTYGYAAATNKSLGLI